MSLQVNSNSALNEFSKLKKTQKQGINFNEILNKELSQSSDTKALAQENFQLILAALQNLTDAKTGERVSPDVLDEKKLTKLINFMAQKLFSFQNDFKNENVDFKSVELSFEDDAVYAELSFKNDKGETLNPINAMFEKDKLANSNLDFKSLEKQGISLNESASNTPLMTKDSSGFLWFDAGLMRDLNSNDKEIYHNAMQTFMKLTSSKISDSKKLN